MKRTIFLLTFLLMTNYYYGQITITAASLNDVFQIGNSAISDDIYADSLIDIGFPGGGNNWIFSDSTDNIFHTDIEVISTDSSPEYFATYFSSSDFAIRRSSSGFISFQYYYYYNLDTNLRLNGKAWDDWDFLNIYNYSPFSNEYILPLSIESEWESEYEIYEYEVDSIYIGSVNASYVVDAYGILTIPTNESYDALRIKEVIYDDSLTISVRYIFLAENGAMASITAAENNPPDSGLITFSSANFNTPFIPLQSTSLDEKKHVSFFLKNYPNPFSKNTTVSYRLPRAGAVLISVYDSMGRKVCTLSDELQFEGEHSVIFDASSYQRSNGLYFLIIKALGQEESLKLTSY